MKGISNNIMQFFKQIDYSGHVRQMNIFMERYKPEKKTVCVWYLSGEKEKCGIQAGKFRTLYMIGI